LRNKRRRERRKKKKQSKKLKTDYEIHCRCSKERERVPVKKDVIKNLEKSSDPLTPILLDTTAAVLALLALTERKLAQKLWPRVHRKIP
jgi:hypothetical protein